MSKSTDRSIPRRTFLTGAASVLGATALGLPKSAWSEPLSISAAFSKLPLAVMYWNGSALVPADSLASGDMTLASVQLTINGFGPTAEIHHVDVHPLIRTASGTEQGVFYAWSAPPSGPGMTRCVMPVDAKGGLQISTRVVIGGASEDVPTTFTLSSGQGPKLVEGNYVLCSSNVSFKGYELMPGANGMQLVNRTDQSPANFQYVVLSVVRN